ncbi:MAG: fatty-acid oxidation protein subunit alpha [Porticoccaceae bacterium]|nr:MAG: fatty-acid oxidation protein subunit alpha [Porticoccaceae bacterium]
MDALRAHLAPRWMELGPAPERGDWRHWRLGRDGDNLAWLLLDCEGAAVNTLDEAVLGELDEVLAHLERRPPRAVVLRSAKESGFCAGADIGLLSRLDDPLLARELVERGHAVLDRLDAFSIPTIAVVHGPCLGGGLELALACNWRLAVEGASFGFPEVLLGLHPGLGGTFRALRVMAPLTALELMLRGRPLAAPAARARGLVDAVLAERHVAAAVAAAAAGRLPRRRRPRSAELFSREIARTLAARRLTAATARRVRPDHYPAPFALIELWRRHGGDERALRGAEIQSFLELLGTPTARNLLRVFALREGLARPAKAAAHDIAHVHVVGAGTMGADIAAWLALQGFSVSIADRDPERLAAAVPRAAALCHRRRLEPRAARAVLDRLIPDFEGAGVGRADLVIEAVPEDAELKRALYAELAPRLAPGALVATNTSSIPLEALRDALPDPGCFLGLHFFNPVARMELVEVVCHDGVAESARARALALVAAIGRLPVAVKSSPGFLVNRVLTPYLLEAMLLLEEGLPAASVDRAALDFGMPVGPVELADRVGLDVCLAVADRLHAAFGDAVPPVPEWLRRKVERGETGRKAGRGLYRWRGERPEKARAPDPPPGTADRLLLPLLNAAVACLREGVVADEATLDGAVIFGTGFAPFRGGPLHYARSRGVAEVVAALEALARAHGPRFAPDPGWIALHED